VENSKGMSASSPRKTFSERAPWLFSKWFPWVLFAVLAVIASVHRLLLGEGSFNNYTIFVYSWKHLLQNVNLYVQSPDHYDLYKYSPTFAMLMAPFASLPRGVGLIFWNLLNMLLPVWAVSRLNITQKHKNLILFIVLIELLSSVQNSQSNGIMLGLIIGAFALFEKGKVVPAMLLICLGFYIKLFAAVAAVLLLFYPQKVRSIASGAFFVLLLGILPLLVITWNELRFQYLNWLELLGNDPAHAQNFSIMTLFERTLGIHAADIFYLIPGMALLLLPMLRTNFYRDYGFRVLYLCSILIWVVIFNHKAESPTFCIALGGIAMWFVLGEKTSARKIVMLLAFLLVALSPTDLFPKYVRDHIINPYALKALMPVVIWCWITFDLLLQRSFLSEWLPKPQTALHTATDN
jgi:hypothetical protein